MGRLITLLTLLLGGCEYHSDDGTQVTILDPDMKCHQESYHPYSFMWVCQGKHTHCTFVNGSMSMSCSITVTEQQVEDKQ
jgi:hypothetical protein